MDRRRGYGDGGDVKRGREAGVEGAGIGDGESVKIGVRNSKRQIDWPKKRPWGQQQ